MARYLKNTNPVVVDAAYDALVDVFAAVPAPTKVGLAEIVKEYVGAGQFKDPIDTGAMLDTSFVDQLAAGGFIKKLYAK